MTQLDERKRAVLCAVVEEYIRSAEPVGSEHPAVRERVGVSPATIRNTMAALEELELLTHPHTSAGRVPTDAGYRLYVDLLLHAEPLPAAERQTIRRRLERTADPDEVPEEAARVLALVTHYASVVASASLEHQTFRSLHLMPVGARRALAVIVTTAGGFQGRVIDLPEGIGPDDLEQLSRTLTQRLQGVRLADLTHDWLERAVDEASWHHRLLQEVQGWLRREVARGGVRIVVEGTRHLLREPEFHRPEAATRVLSVLEEETLLAEALAGAPAEGVWITIGSENRREELRACSLVVATYRAGGQPAGLVGLVGPTRMRYRRAVSAVRYVADRLSEALAALE
ncbi:MAG: heat-inducible transcriptional repressor HrcA [Armatimonadota bacterium]|nr:heat-inducible transcriptional repressor HrcA [Armatimonadota bacterium]MDR7536549.1 heat-inducible transcriptional repressor HrcA [Armatimonadota bacterium]